MLWYYILLLNKVIYKWPYLYIKPKFTNSTEFNS